MSRLQRILLAVSVTAASPACGYPTFTFDGAGGAGGGGPPLTCATVHDMEGCCDKSGVLHYCDQNMSLTSQMCSAGQVCGWNSGTGYYDCVPPPSQEDPLGLNSIACGP
jgi:hypothetical protein